VTTCEAVPQIGSY